MTHYSPGRCSKPPAPVRCAYAMEILQIDWKDICPTNQSGLPQKGVIYETSIRTGHERQTAYANLPLRQGSADVKIRRGKGGGYLAVHGPVGQTNEDSCGVVSNTRL